MDQPIELPESEYPLVAERPCLECGCDLRDLPANANCPACDTPNCLDQAGVLSRSVACARCGYDLRGLQASSLCPECAAPISCSLRGDLLQNSDPRWMDRLARGMNWIVASQVIGALGTLGLIPLVMAIGTVPGSSAFLFQMIFATGIGAIGFVGYWLVTTPEPRRAQSELQLSVRAIVRVSAIVSFILGPSQQGLALLHPMAALGAGFLASVVRLVEVTAMLIYARRLALRIPDERLARHTRIVMWGMAVSLLGMMPATLAPWIGPAAAAPGCVAFPAILVFGIWSLLLILRYRKAFNEQAAIARSTWAAEPA